MRVLNIGSLNIDKTYAVKRFVQPKETIKALSYQEFCGGKGLNQSVALARAGAGVWHAGAVGSDGAALRGILEEAGVRTELIKKTDGPSGHAVIQIDENGQNNIIICGGANDCIAKEDIQAALERFEAGDLLLLQNEISNVGYAIREAKRRAMTVAFNPSPLNGQIEGYDLDLIDYFLVNEVEGKALSKKDSDDPEEIMHALRQRFPHAAFIMTLGENGAYYFDREKIIFQEIYQVETVDTTAAGDTFCGYFIEGLTRGLEPQINLKRASAASALSVGKKGAAPSIPDAQAVEKFMIKENKTNR